MRSLQTIKSSLVFFLVMQFNCYFRKGCPCNAAKSVLALYKCVEMVYFIDNNRKMSNFALSISIFTVHNFSGKFK